VSVDAGAFVAGRPEHLSGPFVASERAIEHVLEITEQNPDLVVMLQCTNPLREVFDIPRAVDLMDRYDSVLSVVEMQQFVWNSDDHGAWASNYNPVAQRPMRQQVNQYIENGSIYVFRPVNLYQTGTRLFGNIGLHVMNSWSRFEIDTAEDLKLLEWIYANEY
jgi:N-acylneuraminate cytidylyltransferase